MDINSVTVKGKGSLSKDPGLNLVLSLTLYKLSKFEKWC